MKIGILTQRLHPNYGGLLQNYALQTVLRREGHEVLTIDWNAGEKKLSWYLKVGGLFIAHFLLPKRFNKPEIGYTPTKREQDFIESNIVYFRDHYLSHTAVMKSESDFKSKIDQYGFNAFIVGSDQCWRPCYNKYQREMFISFAEQRTDVRRIAYAASFGSDKWEFNEALTRDCSRLAAKFDVISVREDSGVELCRNNLGVKATHVLDPTLLLNKEDYISLVEKEHEQPSGGSLYYYFLDPDDEKLRALRCIEERSGLVPFSVIPKYNSDHCTKENVKNEIEDCVYPSVTKWLRAFMDAEMVVVDSFHGMVFSIIFNKPFWVLGNPKRGMTRFESLLKIFNLEGRLIASDQANLIDWHKPIDWESVNQKKIEWQRLSMEVLFKYI